MKYIEVSGLKKPVSCIMMGTGWFMPQYEQDILPTLNAYYQAGGNVLDTGRFYAGGASELVVRKWLDQNRDCRENLVITSKACHHFVDRNNVHHTDKPRVSPEHITKDLTASLNSLGLCYFDLFLMHRDKLDVPVDGLMDRLESHYQKGQIKAYGVSNWTLPRIEQAMEYCAKKNYAGIVVNSPSFSLAKVTTPRFAGAVYATKEDLAWHKNNNIALFAWAAQSAGFFSDAMHQAEPPQDIKTAYFTPVNFGRLSRARLLAEKKGCTPTNIALAYVLQQPLTIAGVIAPHNISELQSSLSALKITLSPEEIAYLEQDS